MAGRFDILSIRNPAVKELFRLRVGRRRVRDKKGLALVRGRRIIGTVGEFFRFKQVFTHEPRETFDRYNAEQVVRVEKAILKHIFFGQNVQAEAYAQTLDEDDFVLGTIEQPSATSFLDGWGYNSDANFGDSFKDASAEPQPLRRLLALDGVKHPENMGMLLSSAVALRYDGIFLSGNCVDPFNYKVLEASQAVAWTMPYCFGTTQDLLAICQRHQLRPCAAAAASGPGSAPAVPVAELPELDERRHKGFCLAVGSESKGVSPDLLERCTRVALPMSELVESLNAGVAGGILMHSLACAWSLS